MYSLILPYSTRRDWGLRSIDLKIIDQPPKKECKELFFSSPSRLSIKSVQLNP